MIYLALLPAGHTRARRRGSVGVSISEFYNGTVPGSETASAQQVAMDFGHRSTNETGNGSLLDSGDPHIHEVAKAAREELRQPMPPVVSARAHHEHAITGEGSDAHDC